MSLTSFTPSPFVGYVRVSSFFDSLEVRNRGRILSGEVPALPRYILFPGLKISFIEASPANV
jgi:hypothetical protein